MGDPIQELIRDPILWYCIYATLNPGPAIRGAGLILRQTLKTQTIASFSTVTRSTLQNPADTVAVSFSGLLMQLAHPHTSPRWDLFQDLAISLGTRAATRRWSDTMLAASNKTFATREMLWARMFWKITTGANVRSDVSIEKRLASSGAGRLTLATIVSLTIAPFMEVRQQRWTASLVI